MEPQCTGKFGSPAISNTQFQVRIIVEQELSIQRAYWVIENIVIDFVLRTFDNPVSYTTESVWAHLELLMNGVIL